MVLKFCIDCKHVERQVKCNSPMLLTDPPEYCPVLGTHLPRPLSRHCGDLRRDEALCGPDGAWFEMKLFHRIFNPYGNVRT